MANAPSAGTQTKPQDAKGEAHPRLPHEHDASHDSQDDPARAVGKQAFRDIESGQQDTDRYAQPGIEKPENREAAGAKKK